MTSLTTWSMSLRCPSPTSKGGFTGFIDSGWYAMGTEESFREGIDFTVECILDSDIDKL